MKTYLINYDQHLQRSNKLHDAFHEYLKTLHRRLIFEITIPTLEQEIAEKTKELNKNYPRCKPIEITRFDDMRPDRTMFINGYMFLIKLLHVSGSYTE